MTRPAFTALLGLQACCGVPPAPVRPDPEAEQHASVIGDPDLGPPGGDAIPPRDGMPGVGFAMAVRGLGVEFGAWHWKRGAVGVLTCTVRPTAGPLQRSPAVEWRRLTVTFYDRDGRELEGGPPGLGRRRDGRLEVDLPAGPRREWPGRAETYKSRGSLV